MPLADHLRELRNRLMKSVLAILAVTVVAMIFYERIADFLTEPVLESVGCDDKSFGEVAEGQKTCAEITINGLIAPFTIMLKVALTAGVVIASPIWLHQLWGFLAPGLHKNEKKYARIFAGTGAPLFLTGATLAYLVLPTAAKTLLEFSPESTNNLIPLDDFLDIVTRLVIVFGLAFELPLLLVMLNLGGVLSAKRLLSWWRWMVLCITIFSAMATPTGDPLTMIALAAPIVLLYFAAVGVCFLNDRRRRRSNPYTDLDDDEAAPLDHTPESVGSSDSVPRPRPLPESDGSSDDDGPSGRNGYGDAT